ncbi:MAG: hypothetical protein ABJB97_03145 [Acidobacteriota bacterium]
MSTELEQARIIAERIARRVAGSSSSHASPTARESQSELGAEIAAMRSGLGDLQKRLGQIEAKIRTDNGATFKTDTGHASEPVVRTDAQVPFMHSPWLAGVNATAAHPSLEKFGVEEAVVSELVDYFEKEKTCSVEPGGKPCDHCSMCSSRGF